MNRLAGKKALITGGTSGIGLETARLFVREGARVALTGQSAKNVAAAQQEFGSDVLAVVSDSGDVAQQQDLGRQVGSTFGQIDILVVNAGIAELKPIEAWTEAAYNRVFDINVRGPFFLIQALLPYFANPASIVLNSSINAHIGMPNSSVYGASKAALLSLVRTLSGELIGRGIRVNAVSPGPIETPLYGKLGLAGSDLQNVSDSIRSQVPAGRFGHATEIANAFLFLASDEAAFTVGSELIIDGGMRL